MKWINIVVDFLTNINPLLSALGILMALIFSFVSIRKICLEIKEKKIKLNQNDLSKPEITDKSHPAPSTIKNKISSCNESLPGELVFFLGRNTEINTINHVLLDSGKAIIVFISGLGGIGKTALSLEIAHQSLIKKSFSHIIWESAKQEELYGDSILEINPSSLTLKSFLDYIANHFDRPEIIKIPELDKKKLAVRNLLKENSTLIILDNMETCKAFSEIIMCLKYLCNTSSKAIITSRTRLDDLDFVYSVHLTGLEKEQSVAFLRKEIEIRNITTMKTVDESILNDIWKVSGGAPLAMKLIIGQSERHSVENVLNNLKKARGNIYKFIYLESWEIISTDAQKLLVAFSPFTHRAKTDALKAVSTLGEDAFTQALDELLRMSLAEVSQNEDTHSRDYHIHPLTQHFIMSDLREIWENQNQS